MFKQTHLLNGSWMSRCKKCKWDNQEMEILATWKRKHMLFGTSKTNHVFIGTEN
jgi:hypothetical protein